MPAKNSSRKELSTALDDLDDAVSDFLLIEEQRHRSYEWLHHTALAALHRVCAALLDCEEADCADADILRILGPVREIHSRSPFVARLQQWPRGYSGDYETVEYIHRAENLAPEGTLERHCEAYSLNFPIAQQHRNKIRHQANIILRTLVAKPKPRILAMACGGCPDFREVLPFLERFDVEIWLNDSDPAALTFASEQLASISDRCHFEAGNALTLMRRWRRGEPFDLILAGGLFDYLEDEQAAFVIRHAQQMLAEGGTFFFTNIAEGNPYRTLIEYVGNWRLKERTRDALLALTRAANVADAAVSIRSDETQLAYLVEVTRT